MSETISWRRLWADLAIRSFAPYKAKEGKAGSADPWRERAVSFDERSRRKMLRDDPVRDRLLELATTSSAALDIGAGTGRWTMALARKCATVTALDPSPSMLAVLRKNMVEAQLNNVDVIEAAWPQQLDRSFELVLCAHAMYGVEDLPTFVRAMIAASTAWCCMVMRVPTIDGVMADATRIVWGHEHDSTNFTVGYNVILEMGIRPNVVMDNHYWEPWRSASLADALENVKQRLGLQNNAAYDEKLAALLQRRLLPEGKELVWPSGVQSALIYWHV